MTPSSQSILKGHNIELGTKNEDEVGLAATKLVNYGNANTKKKLNPAGASKSPYYPKRD